MSLLGCTVPSAPDWRVDWLALDERYDWIRALRGCPQDPVHHAEGDVWTHARMVCEALAGLAGWRTLDAPRRELSFTAALLHDIAKPACTKTENGRITARGHSQRGSTMARRILWESGADISLREQVCAMVLYHQSPFFLIERVASGAVRTMSHMSQRLRCDLLAMHARADVLGRICADREDILTRIGLFEELCREHGCLDRPWPFPSPLSRFEYFHRADSRRDPAYMAHDESKCEVILMCGLPGSGKDTWLETHTKGLPVVSLDEIREETGAAATGNQGAVVQAARERAREFLRKATPFAWNATNLTRELRSQLVDLFTAYRARVRIVHVEAPADQLFQRNADRERAVPGAALTRMLDRWEVPDATEAPIVEWWESEGGGRSRQLGAGLEETTGHSSPASSVPLA